MAASRACVEVLSEVCASAESGPFLRPVDETALGSGDLLADYLRTVHFPMDLGTVRSRAQAALLALQHAQQPAERRAPNPTAKRQRRRRQVSNWKDKAAVKTPSPSPSSESAYPVASFAADVRQVWHNCRLFNAEGSGIWEAATSLAANFERLLQQRVPVTQQDLDEQEMRFILMRGNFNHNSYSTGLRTLDDPSYTTSKNKAKAMTSPSPRPRRAVKRARNSPATEEAIVRGGRDAFGFFFSSELPAQQLRGVSHRKAERALRSQWARLPDCKKLPYERLAIMNRTARAEQCAEAGAGSRNQAGGDTATTDAGRSRKRQRGS